MFRIFLPLLGVLVLVLLFADVLVTVFHPHGRGGPFNRRQNRVGWSLVRRFAVVPGAAPRTRALSFFGPVLAVLTISVWATLLVIGFALIYAPWIDTFPSSPDAARSAWADPIYYSGFVASTLGLGDVVPPTPSLRLLTVAEALAGFILIPVSVTYVLAVYRELGTATSLALDISGYLGVGIGERVAQAQGAEGLRMEAWADATARDLFRVTQAHSQYPILHYFYSADGVEVLLVQVGQLLRYLEAMERSGTAVGLHALRAAVARYVRVINDNVVPEGFEPVEVAEDDEEPEAMESRFERVQRYMLYPAEDATPAR